MGKCDNCPSILSYVSMVIGAVLIGIMLWFSGYVHGRHATYLEAVRENHAHWEADKVTGRPHIEWNK